MTLSSALLSAAYARGLAMPYSSASLIYRVAGRQLDYRFGDTCIGQARAVYEELVTLGCETAWFVRDGRHHLLLMTEGSNLTLFDPYLMHHEPVQLDWRGANRAPFSACVAAYPTVMANDLVVRSSLEVLHPTPDRLELRKHRYSARSREYQVASFDFTLSQGVALPAQNEPALAFAAEQTTLSVRWLDRPNSTTTHLVYPVAQAHRQRIVASSLLYAKTNSDATHARGTTAYRAALEFVSDNISCRPDELESYLMDAAELYERFAPPEISYYSKNPVNN